MSSRISPGGRTDHMLESKYFKNQVGYVNAVKAFINHFKSSFKKKLIFLVPYVFKRFYNVYLCFALIPCEARFRDLRK